MDSAWAGWLFVGVLMAMIIAAAPAAIGAEYYLSPDGDDAAAGDRENPWQSIAKANETLEPGDAAIFLEGEYAGTIAPENNGTADAPITYRSEEPWAARLVAEDVSMLMEFDGHEHIIVEDFELDGLRTAGWLDIADSHYLTIRGCNMRRASPTMSIRNCTQIKLLDNVFSKDTPTGDTLRPLNCSQMLIEGNSFTRVGHCPLVLQEMVDSVVRGNVFRAEWGRNYSFWACGRILIEQNIITRARDSAWSADPVAKNLYDDSIFRFNRIFDNLGRPMSISSYIYSGVGPTSLYRYPFKAMNSRFYHNSFVDNLGPAWSLGGMNVSAHKFQNNIFYRNNPYGGNVQLFRHSSAADDNQFITNLLRGTEPGQRVVRYEDNYWTAEQANENTRTVGGFWSQFYKNIDADPAFVDPDNRDYRLSAESAAVDAGQPLALALGSGTGTELPVTDGIPFYDGFGIEGEEGDFIAIGEGDNIAQIEEIELRYYRPAILHLDREVSWEDGMAVSLPWVGEAPDIGAYERSVEHPRRVIALAKPAIAEPGQPIQFSLDTLGKEVQSVVWDFEDGSRSAEQAPTHSYDATGQYGVTARVTFANGRRSMAALFVKVPERIEPVLPLVQINFEDETYMKKWGWYMKFYRGHQTGQDRVDCPEREGRCMHLFYDSEKRNSTAGEIAPGAWDIDEYPRVRFAYRIPEGVPVGIELRTFGGPDKPDGFILGGTPSRAETVYQDLDAYTLVADGQWHEITVDVREARQAYPELQHLYNFLLRTGWKDDQGQELWFDDFSILPDEEVAAQ